MKTPEPDEETTYKEATTRTEPVPMIPGPPQETGTMAENGRDGLGTATEERIGRDEDEKR